MDPTDRVAGPALLGFLKKQNFVFSAEQPIQALCLTVRQTDREISSLERIRWYRILAACAVGDDVFSI
jgi:hypothetical protein